MKNWLKIALLNAGIVVAGVICYSDGFLGLRLADPSIIRAGLSVIAGIALAAALGGGNYLLLKEPSAVPADRLLTQESISTDKIEALFKKYYASRYFGDYARTSVDQLHRIEKCMSRASAVINTKFTPGSITADRYSSVVAAAAEAAMNNMKAIAVGMQMFDDEEYRRLQHYKEDDIPDDIQEKQIDLYNRNFAHIKDSIAKNEHLILKTDTLVMEISAGNATEDTNGELLEEISKLTEELKYYT